jgi:branched-chain amino acid transport system substrate-binding protein
MSASPRAALLAFLTLFACARSERPARAEEAPIRVGWITELSGLWDFQGRGCRAALQLAEEEIARAGGVLGRPLVFDVADDATSPDRALALARTMIADPGVAVISGTTSSDIAMRLYPEVEAARIPFVVPVAANPRLTRPGTRYTFRVEPDSAGWGYTLARFVEHERPGARVALVYSDYSSNSAAMAGFRWEAARAGLRIVSDIAHPKGASAPDPRVTALRGADADYVVVFGAGNGAGSLDDALTAALLAQGFRADQLLHPHGSAAQLLAWGQPSIGSYFGTFFDAGLEGLTDQGRAFLATMRARTGQDAAYVENNCYVAARLIRDAIAQAGTPDRARVRDAISALRTRETTTGLPIAFDADGARAEFMYVMQLTGVTATGYTARQVFEATWDRTTFPMDTLSP